VSRHLLDEEKARLMVEANVADETESRFETGIETENGRGRGRGREIARGISTENENGIVIENATGTEIGTKLRRRGTEIATETVIGIVERKKTVTVTTERSETPQPGALFPFPPPPPMIAVCPQDQTHQDIEMVLLQKTYLGRDEDLLMTRCVIRVLQSGTGLIEHHCTA
jgi:hypothetical protein